MLWGGIIDPWTAPPNEFCGNFMGQSGVVYRPNYTVIRKCRRGGSGSDGEFVDVQCKVTKSKLNKPLFECSYENVRMLATSCSKASRDILSSLGQTGKRWSGTEFFGFYREDVVQAVTAISDECEQPEDVVECVGGNGDG